MVVTKTLKQLAVIFALLSGAIAAQAQSAMLPPPDPSYTPRTTGYNLGGSVNNDVFRKPDPYTDNPQVDADGVRHFSNGRHFDLSKVPLEDAIAQTNASTLGAQKRKNNRKQLFNKNEAVNGSSTGLNSHGDFQNFAQNDEGKFNQSQFQPYGNGLSYPNNYYQPRQQPYVTDWGLSRVAAANNQNYIRQSDFYNHNQRRRVRKARWNWN